MNTAQLVGIAAQLVGVVITVRGVQTTWHKYPTGAPFFGRAGARLRVVQHHVWKFLGIRRDANVGVLAGTLSIVTSTSGSAREKSRPLPEEPAAFRAEVGRRLELLDVAVQSHDEEIAAERKERKDADEVLDASLNEQRTTIEGMVSEVATGGLRDQVLGAGLVVVGVVCQVLGGL